MHHRRWGPPERVADVTVCSRPWRILDEEHIRGDDGHEFTGYLTLPDSGSGSGMVVIQEIFGVTDYIKDVCARLSDLGYVALAPDLYSRIEANPSSMSDPRMRCRAPSVRCRSSTWRRPRVIRPALVDHLRTVPEVSDGRAGIIGFCLGGGMAYLVAAASEPDVAVCYYGSAISGQSRQGGRRALPGALPVRRRRRVHHRRAACCGREAFEGRPHTEFHLHHGPNHAFDNHNAAMFHHPEAAARPGRRRPHSWSASFRHSRPEPQRTSMTCGPRGTSSPMIGEPGISPATRRPPLVCASASSRRSRSSWRRVHPTRRAGSPTRGCGACPRSRIRHRGRHARRRDRAPRRRR